MAQFKHGDKVRWAGYFNQPEGRIEGEPHTLTALSTECDTYVVSFDSPLVGCRAKLIAARELTLVSEWEDCGEPEEYEYRFLNTLHDRCNFDPAPRHKLQRRRK